MAQGSRVIRALFH